MARVTEEARQSYDEQVSVYQQQLDALLIREKNMLIRITSYNVCYTKLLRWSRPVKYHPC